MLLKKPLGRLNAYPAKTCKPLIVRGRVGGFACRFPTRCSKTPGAKRMIACGLRTKSAVAYPGFACFDTVFRLKQLGE
jgi:hypothetical protein